MDMYGILIKYMMYLMNLINNYKKAIEKMKGEINDLCMEIEDYKKNKVISPPDNKEIEKLKKEIEKYKNNEEHMYLVPKLNFIDNDEDFQEINKNYSSVMKDFKKIIKY